MDAYQTAVRAGIGPAEFWGLTPYQTRMVLAALHDRRAEQAWLTAALSRAKKMPPMEKVMAGKTASPESLIAKSKTMFRAHNAQMKSCTKTK